MNAKHDPSALDILGTDLKVSDLVAIAENIHRELSSLTIEDMIKALQYEREHHRQWDKYSHQ